MVFVFARNATVQTATGFRDRARMEGDARMFRTKESAEYDAAISEVKMLINHVVWQVVERWVT